MNKCLVPVLHWEGGGLTNTINFDIYLESIVIFSPIRGSFSEVGGILSPMTMRKTVIERSVVIPRVT